MTISFTRLNRRSGTVVTAPSAPFPPEPQTPPTHPPLGSLGDVSEMKLVLPNLHSKILHWLLLPRVSGSWGANEE